MKKQKWKWDIRKAPQASYLLEGKDIVIEVTPECLPSKQNQRLIQLTPEMLDLLSQIETYLTSTPYNKEKSVLVDKIVKIREKIK